MFEKFTEGAIRIIMLAQEESRRTGHSYVGTEQLLVGCIAQRYGLGAQALKKARVRYREVRSEIRKLTGKGRGFIPSELPFTPRAKRVLELALYEAKDLGQNYVGTEHLVLALIGEQDGIARRVLDILGINLTKLRNIIYKLIEDTNNKKIQRPVYDADSYKRAYEALKREIPTISEHATNVTLGAAESKYDPVIGREKEIRKIVRVLIRRRKNNPVLIGEPGVGKTSVIEGFAQLIISDECPEFVSGFTIAQIDFASILAGTKYRGEFEERLKKIVEEAIKIGNIVLYVDEIHTLVGAGAAEGAVDAANILKPALAKGELKLIGATTTDEYRKYIERDPALERRFIAITIEEPDKEVTLEILRGMKLELELHHSVLYEDAALKEAIELTTEYVPERFLPDKAIDVLDEAASKSRTDNEDIPPELEGLLDGLQRAVKDKVIAQRMEDWDLLHESADKETEFRSQIRIWRQSTRLTEYREQQKALAGDMDIDPVYVTAENVAQVIAEWTGVPVTKISGDESKRLLKMEEQLHERIIGQHHAIVSVSQSIRRARTGLRSTNRPIASFIFAGPTGVGKTELSKAIAEFMFGSDKDMIRLDMSEYMEKHTVAKLIGSPPGYVGYTEGGQLTEAISEKPYAIVLFDEVEKAHPDVYNLMLQILDDGRLTDSRGEEVDFTNALIIMTTNIGARKIEKASGIESPDEEKKTQEVITIEPPNSDYWMPPSEEIDPGLAKRVKELVIEDLKGYFRPEFLNRVDEIIVFRHLTQHEVWLISNILFKGLKKQLDRLNLNLDMSKAAQAFIVEEGFDPVYGARPLRRAIARLLETPIADLCLYMGGEGAERGAKLIVERSTKPAAKFDEYCYLRSLDVTIVQPGEDDNFEKGKPMTEKQKIDTKYLNKELRKAVKDNEIDPSDFPKIKSEFWDKDQSDDGDQFDEFVKSDKDETDHHDQF